MATRFLKPKSVQHTRMGAYEYRPHFVVLEAGSAADLQALINTEVGVSTLNNDDRYFVIEDVEYQVTYAPGGVVYSAMVWITEVVVL